MGKRRDRLREAAALQEQIREQHGEDADTVMAQLLAGRAGASSSTVQPRRRSMTCRTRLSVTISSGKVSER